MMWYILAISGWILVGGVCALSIYSEIKHKKQHKEFIELEKKYGDVLNAYEVECRYHMKAEADLVNEKQRHNSQVQLMSDEIQTLKLKYTNLLSKHIETLEKIIWVDENKRGDTNE